MRRWIALVFVLAIAPSLRADKPDWVTPLPPFQIADNLYYVGSRDLTSFLVTTPEGNILINPGLTSSPARIRASVEKLGFRWADTKIVLNSQAHFDHVAGMAQVLRETGAKDMVMDGDAAAVLTGGRADFAFGTDGILTFPPARVDRMLQDGDTVTLGDPRHGGVVLTAHKTAGHTRGCTTWTLQVHIPGEPAGRLRNVVIVGGFAALSQYRLVATHGHPASYPGITDDFEATFVTLQRLPCDIFLGGHGSYFDLLAKVARLPKEGPAVFIDPAGYQAAVADARQTFEARLAAQRRAASASFKH
jgi:metallo-beta-lactamase class B